MLMLTDLNELRKELEIDSDDHSEDTKLLFFIEQASEWIHQLLGREDLGYKERTEYYDGTNTPKLLLKARPVFTSPTIRVWADQSAYYGSADGAFADDTELTYGEDFCLKIDQSDGTSRCGILQRIQGSWQRQMYRQGGLLSSYVGASPGSIKVTYTAGFTPDTTPAELRLAANLLVAKMRFLFPLGMEIGSESYEERHLSYLAPHRKYLTQLIWGMIGGRRNWKW